MLRQSENNVIRHEVFETATVFTYAMFTPTITEGNRQRSASRNQEGEQLTKERVDTALNR